MLNGNVDAELKFGIFRRINPAENRMVAWWAFGEGEVLIIL